MNCLLILTIITLNGDIKDNTQPRVFELDNYKTEKECLDANSYRDDLNKWKNFSDHQGSKKSKSECVCFDKKEV